MGTAKTVSKKHKFPYKWNLSDGYPATGIEHHGSKVFGTFVCGGGSTMGYKLAGFDHFGGVEIDPKVAEVYRINHNPKHLFIEDIREFNKREDLPPELYDLDLLDGSPPCSSFSMAGNREKDWGKKKQFREGQELQRLDDLVFEYVRTIEKLQPKVALLENVKGLIQGNAKAYAKNLKKAFEAAGYRVQVFLLNAASMGVPQKRERVFFIGQREDLGLPELSLWFNEPSIPFIETRPTGSGINAKGKDLDYWANTNKKGRASVDRTGNTWGFLYRAKNNLVCATLVSQSRYFIDDAPFEFVCSDYCKVGSYPLDYNFKEIEPKYLIGMSVPPVMTAQIARQIWLQWLSKIVPKNG